CVLGLEDVLVPAGGQNGSHGRLADVTAAPPPMLRQDLVESLQSAHAGQMKELLPRMGEVLAEIVLHVHALLLQLGIEDGLRERTASTAARRAFRLLLQGAERRAAALHRFADPSLG